MIDLKKLYRQLDTHSKPKLSATDYYIASPIPEYPNHRLAQDKNGNPCLLLDTGKAREEIFHPPLKLENLTVLFDVDCKTINKGKFERKRFTVICCMGNDQLMNNYFLRIGNTIISIIGKTPTTDKIYDAIDKLIELFRVLNSAPRKSVQGLWAELFVISISTNPTSLLEAWHQSPLEKYDFSKNDQRIEVKSATHEKREHYFSLDQLSPKDGLEVLVASIFVERIGTGLSVLDLADTIRSRINFEPELLFHIDNVINMTLGEKWRLAIKDTFDHQLAKKSLQFYFSNTIPSIDQELPKAISDVHFKVDLTNISSIHRKLLRDKGDIFESIIPT